MLFISNLIEIVIPYYAVMYICIHSSFEFFPSFVLQKMNFQYTFFIVLIYFSVRNLMFNFGDDLLQSD